MDKKGFTLIETLATITIIGLITTVASFSIIKILDNKKELEQKTTKEIIEASACTYIELSKNKALKEQCLQYGCDLSTNTLIREGLLKEEDVSNPLLIHIEKKNNEVSCKIK